MGSTPTSSTLADKIGFSASYGTKKRISATQDIFQGLAAVRNWQYILSSDAHNKVFQQDLEELQERLKPQIKAWGGH